jgi:3-oxo-5alpha-steroid 4-dehydrogenase
MIYMGGGTPLQKACGFDDSPDNMARFLMAACGPGADEDKVRLFAQESVDLYEWLHGCGITFNEKFLNHPSWEPLDEEGLMYSGGENAFPLNEIAEPAPRAHCVAGEGGAQPGVTLMSRLTEAAATRGVRFEYDLLGVALIVDGAGVVAGIRCRRYGKDVAVRARRGVVLTTGGFIFNDQMLANYAPRLLANGKVGQETDDGSGIRMAQALRAGVKRMDAGEATLLCIPALLMRSVLVNQFGQRYINEDTYPGRVGQHAFWRQDGNAIIVFDEQTIESIDPRFAGLPPSIAHMYPPQPTHVAETIAELEADLALPDGSLQSTIDQYNTHAADGADPMFHKNSRYLRPLSGPFGAIDLRGQGFRSMTLGGLDTSVNGEVRDYAGIPIPGLYAGGRTTSGIPASGYCSGSSLGDGLFFGRRAGLAAAQRGLTSRP